MAVSRFLTLHSGQRMPTIGLGTYMLKGDGLKEVLDYALFVGYRHIDTAFTYGNEEEIGQVIEDRLRSGKLKRKDLFITTKVPDVYLKGAAVLDSAQCSLSKLKIKYIDCLLIHHPWGLTNRGDGNLRPYKQDGQLDFEHVNLCEAWSNFESLQRNGVVANIGVSNFTKGQIERILSVAKIMPANVQLECHAYFQQNKLKSFCDSKGIVVSAYAPLGALNRPDQHRHGSENLLQDPVIVDIAENYRKSPSQILLNFLLCRGFVVLPKSSNFKRIQDNMDALSWKMTKKDFERISLLDKGVRFYNFMDVRNHPEFFENEDF